ncbi:MAG TPA: homoserine dehydrogenase [Deinococcales bacterium]|nr:homoserine dehydrogenase [Deinococcales bacterium]
MTMNDSDVRSVTVLGAGTVGSSLLQRLETDPGFRVEKVLVRDSGRDRGLKLAPGTLTTDPAAALSGSGIVVELLGGTDLAVELMLQALGEGRSVVTGNKAALAEHWDEFVPYLEAGTLYFEAAVMAGTPAVAPLTGVLRGSEPLQLDAVLNGTCSFIIGRLAEGEEFASALAAAQELGFAEADPTLDIGGFDAAHKLALLGRLAFDPDLTWEAVAAATHGIEELTPAAVRAARADGFSTVLLCSILPGQSGWEAAVRPALLPAGHCLDGLQAGRNGFVFSGRQSGEVCVSGPGAGGDSTASAVMADLLDIRAGRRGPAPLAAARPLPLDYAAVRHRDAVSQ